MAIRCRQSVTVILYTVGKVGKGFKGIENLARTLDKVQHFETASDVSEFLQGSSVQCFISSVSTRCFSICTEQETLQHSLLRYCN